MPDVKFYSGSKQAFNSLAEKDQYGVYFLTNGEIYKGAQKMASGVESVSSLPSTDEAAQGVLYVLPTGEAQVFNGTSFTTVIYPTVATIEEDTSATSIPNVGAVKAAIAESATEAVEVDNASISKNDEGKIEIKGFKTATDGQQIRIKVVDGVNTIEFYTPTIDAEVAGIEESITGILGDMSDLKDDILTAEQNITNLTGNVTNLSESKADKSTTLAGYGITDAYTKVEVDGMVQGAMHYRGAVASYDDLETIENPQSGDIYQVTDEDGKMYIYNGTAWDDFNGGIDLSGYVQTADFTPVQTTVNSLPNQILTDIVNVTRTPTTNTAQIQIATKTENGTYSTAVQHGVITLIPAGQGVDGVNGAGLMTAADKAALDGIVAGTTPVTPPAATTDTLGGVKVDGSTIRAVDGTISVLKTPNALTVGSKTFDGSAAVSLVAGDMDAYTKGETDSAIASAVSGAMAWNEL